MRILLAVALLLTTAGIAVAFGVLAFADGFADTERRTHDVRASVSRVVVQGSSGDVDVRPSADGRVTVRETRRSLWREPEFHMSARDGVLLVSVDCPSASPGCSDDLDIAVPRSLDSVQVEVDSGDVSLGSLRARRTVAHSDSGDVEVRGHAGPLDLAADSGDVLAEDVRGAVRMAADSGDVTGRGLRGERVTGTADSGDVSIAVLAAPRALAVSADSGDVEVDVPSGRYRVAAEADSGDVEVERLLRDDLAPRRIDARADSGDVVVRGR
jgi:hypothetical protein